jgi:hypothetical protein
MPAMNLHQVWALFLLKEACSVSSIGLSEEAVLRADGKVIGAKGQRKASVMRRHEEDRPSLPTGVKLAEIGQSDRDKAELDKFFKSMARPSFTRPPSLVESRSGSKSKEKKRATAPTWANSGRVISDDTAIKRTSTGHGEEALEVENKAVASGGAEGGAGSGGTAEGGSGSGGAEESVVPPAVEPAEFEWPAEWLGNQMEVLQDDCSIAIGKDIGLSDYGTVPHECEMCSKTCTNENKQQTVTSTWNIEPSLKDSPAKSVHFYTKMESIDDLACEHCLDWQNTDAEEIGISHNYEIDFSATKGDGKDVPNFKSMVGSYISTEYHGSVAGTGPNEFPAKLFFLVRDTVPPKNLNGCKNNPPGRRYALQGASRFGELFYCQRFCTTSDEDGGCACGFMDAIGCAVHVHVATGMMIKFALRVVADDAMAPMMGHDGKPKSLGGQQWEAVATFGHDDSDYKIDAVLGRVILTGNGEDEGIVEMKQNVHHKGCTPCDMYYSSFISVGPFISSPANVHWVRSADVVPPSEEEIGLEICRLYRVTARRGHVLLFESGPGLFPTPQDTATLFTCPTPSGNQTR